MYPENNEPTQGFQPPPDTGAQAAHDMTRPPHDGPTDLPAVRSSRRPLLIAAGAVVALLLVGGGTFAVLRAYNVGPLKDSGLATCEAIRDNKNKNKSSGDDKIKADEYLKLRKKFSGSRYDDIRDSGTKFVDLVRQFDGTDKNSDGALGMALVLGGQLVQSYSSLSGACANHGVTIPPLSQN